MVCTYNSDLFKIIAKKVINILEDFISGMYSSFCKTFDKLKGNVSTEVILMLLPVQK